MGWERIESTRHKIIAKQESCYVFEDRLRKYRQTNIFSAWSCYDYPFNVMLKMLSDQVVITTRPCGSLCKTTTEEETQLFSTYCHMSVNDD